MQIYHDSNTPITEKLTKQQATTLLGSLSVMIIWL